MPDIFIYLIKANLAIILFYLGYRLLLRKLTFYNLNRFYLLFALLFSALYPLVDVQGWFVDRQMPVSEVIYVLPEWEVAPVEQFNPWPYVSLVICVVAGFFGLRFLVRLFSLWAIHRQSSPAQWRLFRYRQVFRQVNPFSFWRTIYLNPQQHGQHELEDIFHHEQVHVDELHTLDILLAETYSVLCWFNPGAWLMRHAVRENLEFITDRRVLQSGMDKKAYQYSLLKASTAQYNPALASNFNLKSIKRRIAMMNSGRSSRLHLGKYLFVIPAIALFVLVFTITKAQQDRSASEETDRVVINGDVMPVRGMRADSLRIEGVFVATDNDTSGQSVVRSVSDTLTLRLLEGVADSNRPSLRMVYGDSVGATITGRSDFTYRAVFPDSTDRGSFVLLSDNYRLTRLDSSQIGLIERLRQNPNARGNITVRRVSADTTDSKPLIFLNGVRTGEHLLSTLEPSQIAHVEVLKGDAAAAIYGDKGKDGVVLVSTKTGNTAEPPHGASVLKPDSLIGIGTQRLSILRTDTLGESGLMGRLANRTIGGDVRGLDASLREVVVVGYGRKDSEANDFQNALIIVDGKQTSSADLRALSPNQIKQMTVLKGEAATEKYGDKAENGVIEVELEK